MCEYQRAKTLEEEEEEKMASEIPPTVMNVSVVAPSQPALAAKDEGQGGETMAQQMRLRIVPLQEQIRVLDKERDAVLSHLCLLRRIQREGFVRVEDLNVNLMPAINNQRKAHQSLARAVRKVLQFRQSSLATQGVITVTEQTEQSNAAGNTNVAEQPIDEVDMAGNGNNGGGGGEEEEVGEEEHEPVPSVESVDTSP